MTDIYTHLILFVVTQVIFIPEALITIKKPGKWCNALVGSIVGGAVFLLAEAIIWSSVLFCYLINMVL